MQTFLPYPSFVESAKCLDYKRLGKQRVESRQLLRAISDPNYAWSKHPAAKMWRGYSGALSYYYNVMVFEWVLRGYKNNMLFLDVQLRDNLGSLSSKIFDALLKIKNKEVLGWLQQLIEAPKWLNDSDFHAAHRSNLLRKNYNYYSQFGWQEKDNLAYIWPT